MKISKSQMVNIEKKSKLHVIEPIKACSNVLIGAESMITKNILKSNKYEGYSAKMIK